MAGGPVNKEVEAFSSPGDGECTSGGNDFNDDREMGTDTVDLAKIERVYR